MPQIAQNIELPAELDSHRAYLYRYAMQQLRDANGAEDVVQETLLAALESRSAFAGRSSLRTWLTGILKHKILDLIRKQVREVSAESLAVGEDPEEARAYADQFFDKARTDVPTTGMRNPRRGRTPSAPSSRSDSGRRSSAVLRSCPSKQPGCSRCGS
jgi:RNA polymerase sigma factor (sigma-70 family)